MTNYFLQMSLDHTYMQVCDFETYGPGLQGQNPHTGTYFD